MFHNHRIANRAYRAAAALLAIALFLLILAPTEAAPTDEGSAPAWTTIASGLANPRHLTFGPDGALYVAEAGSGGDGACVAGAEGGDVCLGKTGAITKVTLDAAMAPVSQTQVVTGVVSLGAKDTGENATGPHSVAFLGDDMVFVVGLGADPAIRAADGPFGADGALFAQIMTAGPGDTFTPWVDLGAHEAVENPDGVLPPDTNPFALITVGDDLLATDAGGNTLLAIDGDTGSIDTEAVFPARMVEFPPHSGSMMPMQAVPTAVAVGPDGAWYVSQLTGFPFPMGGANVWRVAADGNPTVYADGFTNILDLAFDSDGSLYVLEMFANSMLSGDPTGAIIRVAPDGGRTVIADEGLITPTGMTIGPDHALYVSNFGTSATAGAVVRIPTPPQPPVVTDIVYMPVFAR